VLPAFRELTLGLFLLLAMAAADRNVRGVVTDESKGVLPGVTVVAAAADGRVLATTVTDGGGRYVMGPLAPGPVTVTFQLEGFAAASVRVAIVTGADVLVNQVLTVAPRSESVLVVGKVPAPPPPPPAPPPPVARPRPVTVPVPEHDRDSICGPARLGARAESLGTVRSRRYASNELYSKGDELIIDGGTRSGLQVGRNAVVRRTYRIEWEPHTEIGEHTSGLVQIVSADEETSVAVVIYACDEIVIGDRLASFSPVPRRAPGPTGTPDFKYAARILFPDLGQLVGAPGRLMVIDRGASTGVRVGQRVTLFRREAGGRAPAVVGAAIVVAVRTDSATIRLERVTDAVVFGDWAALER
jgi:hypothetical protein